MAGLAGLEPAAFRLGVRRSIHLSYSPARVTMLCARALPVNQPGTPGPSTQMGPGQTEKEPHPLRHRRSAPQIGPSHARRGGSLSRSEARPENRDGGRHRHSPARGSPSAPATSSESSEVDPSIASRVPSAETISQRPRRFRPAEGRRARCDPSSVVQGRGTTARSSGRWVVREPGR